MGVFLSGGGKASKNTRKGSNGGSPRGIICSRGGENGVQKEEGVRWQREVIPLSG